MHLLRHYQNQTENSSSSNWTICFLKLDLILFHILSFCSWLSSIFPGNSIRFGLWKICWLIMDWLSYNLLKITPAQTNQFDNVFFSTRFCISSKLSFAPFWIQMIERQLIFINTLRFWAFWFFSFLCHFWVVLLCASYWKHLILLRWSDLTNHCMLHMHPPTAMDSDIGQAWLRTFDGKVHRSPLAPFPTAVDRWVDPWKVRRACFPWMEMDLALKIIAPI